MTLENSALYRNATWPYVRLGDHTPQARLDAARAVLKGWFGVEDEDRVARLASKAVQRTWRLHTGDPGNCPNGCENAGQMCEAGDGKTVTAWTFDRRVTERIARHDK